MTEREGFDCIKETCCDRRAQDGPCALDKMGHKDRSQATKNGSSERLANPLPLARRPFRRFLFFRLGHRRRGVEDFLPEDVIQAATKNFFKGFVRQVMNAGLSPPLRGTLGTVSPVRLRVSVVRLAWLMSAFDEPPSLFTFLMRTKGLFLACDSEVFAVSLGSERGGTIPA